MSWRWNARRLIISAFLVFHLFATATWVLPTCALKERTYRPLAYYMLPLGLWQCWAMFAPDPVRDTVTLEAVAVDAKGLRYSFAFPKLEGCTLWQGVPRFRYSKYAANMACEELELPRRFAARHAVRMLKVPADSFPVDVSLIYQVRPSPPPGQPPVDAMTSTKPFVIAGYLFASNAEVNP